MAEPSCTDTRFKLFPKLCVSSTCPNIALGRLHAGWRKITMILPYETAAILISHSFAPWSGGNIMPAFAKAVVIFNRSGVSALHLPVVALV